MTRTVTVKLWTGEPRRPWPPTMLNTRRWIAEVPVSEVALEGLTLVQDTVSVRALLTGEAPMHGDPFPHVIAWGGRLWVEDGHHRIVRAVLRGYTHVEARVHET